MIIVDGTINKSADDVTLLLEKAEVRQLIGYLKQLIGQEPNKNPSAHYHLSNADYSKEITIVLYDKNNFDNMADGYKLLITKDE